MFGTFDWFHPGHASLIEQARSFGDVIVIVARDENVRRIKGRLPDQSEKTRMRAVQRAAPDATVVLGDSGSFLSPLRKYEPDHILLGYDQLLPPGVAETDFTAEVHRAAPHHPEKFKSSLRAPKKKKEKK